MTMSTKRKAYVIKEKLDIIDCVKRGISKASLSRQFGVPEGTIRGWMKDEDKLRSFLDQVDDKTGLDRKKARFRYRKKNCSHNQKARQSEDECKGDSDVDDSGTSLKSDIINLKLESRNENENKQFVYTEDIFGATGTLNLETQTSFKKRKTSDKGYNSYILKSPDRLEIISAATVGKKETEFDVFGRTVAAQLNNMPFIEAMQLQLKIQTIITEYRLSQYSNSFPSTSSNSPNEINLTMHKREQITFPSFRLGSVPLIEDTIDSMSSDSTIIDSPEKRDFSMTNPLTVEILHWTNNGNLEQLKLLQETYLKSGKPIEWNNHFYEKSGDTVQHIAARRGHTDILKFLYDTCDSVNFELENLDGKRPLHESAQASQLHCVEFLISIGVKIDPLKRADWTPLMLACTKSNLNVVKCLVESGAQLKLRNKDGWTCFHIACREGIVDIVAFLLQYDEELWNTVSKNGRTPLHTAAIHGQESVVDYLLKLEKYQPDSADNCGSTPFMDALRGGFVHLAKMLYSHQKIDINKRDLLDFHSVHIVAQAGQLLSLKYLVEDMKIDVDLETSNKIGPIHLAAKEGQIEALQYLISKNADINKKDFKGRTALHIAAGALHYECIKILLSNGATDCCDSSGIKPSEMVKNNKTLQTLFQECKNYYN